MACRQMQRISKIDTALVIVDGLSDLLPVLCRHVGETQQHTQTPQNVSHIVLVNMPHDPFKFQHHRLWTNHGRRRHHTQGDWRLANIVLTTITCQNVGINGAHVCRRSASAPAQRLAQFSIPLLKADLSPPALDEAIASSGFCCLAAQDEYDSTLPFKLKSNLATFVRLQRLPHTLWHDNLPLAGHQ